MVAHYPDSGGIFTGAEVTYRGVGIGSVGESRPHRQGRRRPPRHREQVGQDPARHHRPGRQPLRGRRAVRRACSRRPTRAPTSSRAPRSTTSRPRSPPRSLLGDLSATVSSVDRDSLRTTIEEPRQGLRGHRPGPAEDHRHRQLLHRDGQRQLRPHHRADPRRQHGPAGPGSPRRASLRTFASQPVLVQHRARRRGPGAAQGDRLRLGRGHPACAPSWSRTASVLSDLLSNLVTTGRVVVRHLAGIKQAPRGLPVRRRRGPGRRRQELRGQPGTRTSG
ncbi:hypothetical protein G5V59_13635 [Nocardioides sp. W3-2-3]|uniref:hypothetical protein n=1 Tax=Nocardioides convexus TaxID=2712224 RepID=UPI002418A358|nr:hypothetical protein [Nocardioides convexus]NHA00698.1 hypothetical protein [Nocardioides convexus]